jgi:hypothetical protein
VLQVRRIEGFERNVRSRVTFIQTLVYVHVRRRGSDAARASRPKAVHAVRGVGAVVDGWGSGVSGPMKATTRRIRSYGSNSR